MFRVQDGDRTLEFDGEHLAHATSRKQDSERWVEFDLYRTEAGAYVISRVGRSIIYHTADCPIVARRGHQPAPVATLTEDALPCIDCDPETSVDQAHELVYPERPIYWAMAYQAPEDTIEALAKEDAAGNRYFTNVARDLIREASEQDPLLRKAYSVERIA